MRLIVIDPFMIRGVLREFVDTEKVELVAQKKTRVLDGRDTDVFDVQIILAPHNPPDG